MPCPSEPSAATYSNPARQQGGLVFVVVLDRCDRVVVADVKVVVEVAAVRGVPGQPPPHCGLELVQPQVGGPRHQHQGGVSAFIEVDRIRHVVYGEGATRTALVDVVQPHEVVHDQLAAALEQIDQSSGAIGALEHVVLIDQHCRQPATLLCQRCQLPARRLFLDQEIQSRGQPLLPGGDVRGFHQMCSPFTQYGGTGAAKLIACSGGRRNWYRRTCCRSRSRSAPHG